MGNIGLNNEGNDSTTVSSIKTLVLRAQTTLIYNVHVRLAYVVKFLHDLQGHYNLRIYAEMCETKCSVVFEKTVYNLCKWCIKLAFYIATSVCSQFYCAGNGFSAIFLQIS